MPDSMLVMKATTIRLVAAVLFFVDEYVKDRRMNGRTFHRFRLGRFLSVRMSTY